MNKLPINRIICGDCLEVMKKWPANSIDMCLCSPPYWGLRDYGVEQIFGGDKDCEHEWNGCGKSSQRLRDPKTAIPELLNPQMGNICLKCHAWKGQLGLEPTPEMYIEHLTEIFNEVKRVLKKTGTLWLVIGDTYWGGKGKSGYELPHEAEERRGKGETIQHSYNVPGYMEMRPADGKHDFIQPKCLCMIPERLSWSLIQNGWILRNKNIWFKPNGMPSSVKDRFSNKWEYVYMFSKSKNYYFDLDAVREPYAESTFQRVSQNEGNPKWDGDHKRGSPMGEHTLDPKQFTHPKGKNPGDVWEIGTVPCPIKGVHFATFPEDLCRKAIIPGCPEGGIVLDPFCGVGTACYVAQRLRRKFIGIDIKPEYCEKAEDIRLAQGVL